MTFKKAVVIIHLWLGLASGLIVLFLGITGCMLAFENEIGDATQPYRYATTRQQPLLPPSALKAIAGEALPGKILHSAQYLPNGRSAQVSFYNEDPEYYYIVFLDPYTGKVLKVKNMDQDFFRIVVMGHYYLWLPPNIGQPIAGSATMIFVIMLVTGIILWWPKNKAARKQRFNIKWNAKWRRVNYDLHNVLGFYMTWVIIFIALTGLVMGFQWFARAMYWTTSGGRNLITYTESVSDKTQNKINSRTPAVDQVWYNMQKENPKMVSIEIHYPESDSSAIEAAINPDTDTYWKTDYRYFDQYSLKEIEVDHLYGRFKNASAADKLARMNYDIHVGAVLGLTGKCLAFFASLIAASLPVTGFLLWRGRKKKSCSKITGNLSAGNYRKQMVNPPFEPSLKDPLEW